MDKVIEVGQSSVFLALRYVTLRGVLFAADIEICIDLHGRDVVSVKGVDL